MSIIQARKISYNYPGHSETILKDIDFDINVDSRIGVIGPNGHGKTTLINLINGTFVPTEGSLIKSPKLNIGYLRQNFISSMDGAAFDFYLSQYPQLHDLKNKIVKLEKVPTNKIEDYNVYHDFFLLGGNTLEIKWEKWVHHWSWNSNLLTRPLRNWSAGEKTQLALAQILSNDIDLLILDEPTNHLDGPFKKKLINFINKIEKPMVIISHDRHFLDNVTNITWEIKNGQIDYYPGPYSSFINFKKKREQTQLELYENQQKKIRKLKDSAIQKKNWANSHQPQTGKNGYAPVYECVFNWAKHSMKRAKNIENRIERLIEKEEEKCPKLEKKRSLKINLQSTYRGKRPLQVDKLCFSYNKNAPPVIENLNFSLEKGDRLGVVGANGTGKTTLSKLIQGQLSPTAGQIWISPSVNCSTLDQTLPLIDGTLSSEQILKIERPQLTQDLLTTLTGVFQVSFSDLKRPFSELSMGQKKKVLLTKLLFTTNDLCILDEPTNYLDLYSIELLEKALPLSTSTLIIISHDTYFLQNTTSKILDIQSGSITSNP